jgi:hypothetical protein
MNYTVNSADNTGMFGSPTSAATPDVFSQDFKNQIANTKSAYYDIVNAQLQASTDEQKAFADNQASQFKTNLQKSYGITLSNDATQAFNQIQNLESSYGQRGLENSGMMNDSVDQGLRATRLTDQRQRDAEATSLSYESQTQLQQSGTPQQIADSIAADKAKGLPQSQWSASALIPDPATVSKFSISNLTSQFPNSTPAEIQAMHDAVLDENGNLRSSLYATQYGQLSTNLQTQDQNTANNLIKTANQNTTSAMKVQDNTTDPSINVQKPVGTSLGTPVTSQTQNTNQNQQNPATNPNYTQTTPTTQYQGGVSTAQGNAIVAAMQKQMGVTPTSSYTTPTPTYTAPTPAPTPAKSGYQGASIVDYLSSTGGNSSYSSRSTLAAQNGISNYTGTADQNTQLLSKMRGY